MRKHFATENEFRIRCVCGRVISEATEAKARDRFEMHVVNEMFRTEDSAREADR